MKQIEAAVLFTPPSEALRHLPEGPYRLAGTRVSWVAIQHGPQSQQGSLNLLDLATATNQCFPLPGRPGFAFPTQRPGEFIVGLERSLALFDTRTGQCTTLLQGVDREVSNTIINDAVVFEGHLVFGCKDLKFAEKKAGLYLLRAGEREAVQLSAEQVCSNGKAIIKQADGRLTLYDIDSHSKQVLAWELDLEGGRIAHPQVVVDLTDAPVFPDGMILTPDQRGMVVAIYDPRPSDHGQARLYDIETGRLQTVWRCDGSPRVTCPQLVQRQSRTELLLTTADEGMPPEMRAQCPQAGCLFIAETDFQGLNENPEFPARASGTP
jgi:sugar lactone lactonase YvrE